METHLDPARGKKKTALPPGISRKRKARIDARSSQTTRTQPQIPYNCIDARKTRKLRSHATGIFPRFTRAHIFFLDQKRPKCRRGGKKIHRKPRAYVQTRRTRSCENRAVSVFDANRAGKREKRCEHLQFTHHFCLSKIFFRFLLACEKCEESEKREARSERERERERERDEKSKKLGFS